MQDRARVDAEKELEQLRPRIPNLVAPHLRCERGHAPVMGRVALPVLDKDPTPGQDELWNASFPDWTANGGVLVFSEAGVYQEFDDLLVGDYDAEALCERFVTLDAN